LIWNIRYFCIISFLVKNDLRFCKSLLSIIYEINKSAISIRLAQSKINFVIFVLKIILKRQTRIIIILMSIPEQIYCIKSYLVAALKPFNVFLTWFLSRMDWNKHSLIKKRRFLYKVNNIESSSTFGVISKSKEKPIIISICIEIVFNQQIVLIFFFNVLWIDVGFAYITRFKIRVNSIDFYFIKKINFHLQLFVKFPVIVN